MRPAIRSKHHRLLSTGVLLLHDSARPHTAHVTAEMIRDIHFECLRFLPDFALYDCLIFGPLGGRTFWSDEEVQEAVQPKDFFSWESRH
jgi:hypothetical protein